MSWINVPQDSDFSLSNLPYGVFSTKESGPRIGVAIGDYVLDLGQLAQAHVFDDLGSEVSASFDAQTLNDYAALGRRVHRLVRKRLQELLKDDTTLGELLRDNKERRERVLVPLKDAQMHLPMQVGNYTDFFAGLPHAELVSLSIAPESCT